MSTNYLWRAQDEVITILLRNLASVGDGYARNWQTLTFDLYHRPVRRPL